MAVTGSAKGEDVRRRPIRRPNAVIVGLLAVGLALVGLWGTSAALGRADGGGLRVADPTPATVGFNNTHAGATLAWGYVVVINAGKETVGLESMEMLGGPTGDGVSVGMPITADENRPTYATAGGRVFPPAATGPTRPLKGTVIAPAENPDQNRGVEIIVPITVNTDGTYTWTGMRVVYTSGGRTYTVEDHTALVICPAAECG